MVVRLVCEHPGVAVAGVPDGCVEVPSAIAALAHNRPLLPVWQNMHGGLTFQLGAGHDRLFVKWAPARSGLDLAGEVARLPWAANYTCVPQVLDQGHDDTGVPCTTRPWHTTRRSTHARRTR